MEQNLQLTISQALRDAYMYRFWFGVKIIIAFIIVIALAITVTCVTANYLSHKDDIKFAKEAEERARREKIRNEKV